VAAVAAVAALVLGVSTIVLLLVPEPVVAKIAGVIGLAATAGALVVAITALNSEQGGDGAVA
jgi:hypothetical protein